MPKARQIYQAVIRSALSYGASIWHQPSVGKPKGLAARLQKQQNQGLRTVLGAYRATPARMLETELYVPPLDLWLNGQIARFQARLERSGIAQEIRNACSTIRTRILRCTNRQAPNNTTETTTDTPGAKQKLWVEEWTGRPLDQWDHQEKKLVLQDWEKRWHAENRRLGCAVRPSTDIGNRPVVSEDTPPTKQVLGLHKNLYKAESALLVQARTKRIGLAEFLYNRKVPGITTAKCQCRAGHETPRHMALFCIQEASTRQFLLDPAGRIQPYSVLVGTVEGAKKFV